MMKKFTFTLFIILSISMLSACELFGFDSNLQRRIDPEPTMDTLNSEDLNQIMTTENGYKKYKHEYQITRKGTRNVGEDSFNSPPLRIFGTLKEMPSSSIELISYTDTINLDFSGVYHTADDTAYGNVVQTTYFKFEDKAEEEFPALYENNQYVNLDTGEAYHIPFLLDKLKGIDEFIGPVYKYGLTDSKQLDIVFTSKDELEKFADFLNDELEIDYDQLDFASITIGLAYKTEQISYIDVSVRWTKKEGDGEHDEVSYTMSNKLSFIYDEDHKEKQEYENLKNAR